ALPLEGLADAAAEGVVGEGDALAVGPADLGEVAACGPAVGPDAAGLVCLLEQVALAVVLEGYAVRGEQLTGRTVGAALAPLVVEQVAGGVGETQGRLSLGIGRGDQVAALVVLVLDGAAVEVVDAAQA